MASAIDDDQAFHARRRDSDHEGFLAHKRMRWLKVSLHAAFAVFAAALVWPGVASVSLMLALAAGVAWSRLVLQRHTLAEVVVGLLLGSASGLVLNLAVR